MHWHPECWLHSPEKLLSFKAEERIQTERRNTNNLGYQHNTGSGNLCSLHAGYYRGVICWVSLVFVPNPSQGTDEGRMMDFPVFCPDAIESPCMLSVSAIPVFFFQPVLVICKLISGLSAPLAMIRLSTQSGVGLWNIYSFIIDLVPFGDLSAMPCLLQKCWLERNSRLSFLNSDVYINEFVNSKK